MEKQTEFGKEEFYHYSDIEQIKAIKCVYYPQIGFQLAIPIADNSLEYLLSLPDYTDLTYQVQRIFKLLAFHNSSNKTSFEKSNLKWYLSFIQRNLFISKVKESLN
jgi:hypothetical protein